MDGARGWMPAIWRPNVRVSLDEDVEDAVTERRVDEGDEAEEGPLQGAMRARGEVPVAMQGVQRLSAREEAQ